MLIIIHHVFYVFLHGKRTGSTLSHLGENTHPFEAAEREVASVLGEAFRWFRRIFVEMFCLVNFSGILMIY